MKSSSPTTTSVGASIVRSSARRSKVGNSTVLKWCSGSGVREVLGELPTDLLVALPAVEVERDLPLQVRDQLARRTRTRRPAPPRSPSRRPRTTARRGASRSPRSIAASASSPQTASVSTSRSRRTRDGARRRRPSRRSRRARSRAGRAARRRGARAAPRRRRRTRPERVVVGRVRAVRAARAEEHELERVVEPGEVVELGRRPARAAGMADEERAAPAPLVRKGQPVGRGEDLDHGSLPSTTLSRPVRSAVIATSEQPSRSSISATSCAWPSPTSKTTKRAFGGAREPLVLAAAERARPPAPSRSSGWSVLEALDVRRVRDHDVPALGRDGGTVAVAQLDLEPEPLGVLARQRERVGRDVDAGHPRVRAARP